MQQEALNNDSNGYKYDNLWWLGCTICIIGIAIVAVSISDSRELPLTIIGAVLGVAMTVGATFFLFKGQAKQQASLALQQSELQSEMLRRQNEIEREGEKETEIFKQKLKNYQGFLDALSLYLTTKEDSAKTKLKFHTSALAMHGRLENLARINTIVGTIIECSNGGKMSDTALMPALFELSGIFRSELYVKDAAPEENELFKESIKALADAVDYGDDNPDKDVVEAEDAQEAAENDSANECVEHWTDYVASLEGWNVTYRKGNIILTSVSTPALIEFKLKSGYYVVASTYGEDKGYPKFLKNEIKSSARSGTNWWRELNTLRNYRVKSGTLAEAVETNGSARALVIRWIDKLTGLVDSYTTQIS